MERTPSSKCLLSLEPSSTQWPPSSSLLFLCFIQGLLKDEGLDFFPSLPGRQSPGSAGKCRDSRAVGVVHLEQPRGFVFIKNKVLRNEGQFEGGPTACSVGHPPWTPTHMCFPLQQEALPDETEVIEDPTTEVGGSVPPIPSAATALQRASPKLWGAMGGCSAPQELCTHSRNTKLFCRSPWGLILSRWRWESSRNPRRM